MHHYSHCELHRTLSYTEVANFTCRAENEVKIVYTKHNITYFIYQTQIYQIYHIRWIWCQKHKIFFDEISSKQIQSNQSMLVCERKSSCRYAVPPHPPTPRKFPPNMSQNNSFQVGVSMAQIEVTGELSFVVNFYLLWNFICCELSFVVDFHLLWTWDYFPAETFSISRKDFSPTCP